MITDKAPLIHSGTKSRLGHLETHGWRKSVVAPVVDEEDRDGGPLGYEIILFYYAFT
jgi:hypothetical protein